MYTNNKILYKYLLTGHYFIYYNAKLLFLADMAKLFISYFQTLHIINIL